jgi:hypothetical protein
MVRNQVLNIRGSVGGCTVYYRCTECTGRDIVTPGQGANTNVTTGGNVNGTAQGSSFYSANPGQAIQDAYDQKKYQNEALLENGEPNRTVTRDIPFDNAHAALRWINGRDAANGKPFSVGRAGALGGSNIRPGAPAARYNGQMGVFGFGDVTFPPFIPYNPAIDYKDMTPLGITEMAGQATDVAEKSVRAADAFIYGTNNFTVPEGFITVFKISGDVRLDIPDVGLAIPTEVANKIETLEDLQNFFIDIANQARDNQTKAGENKANAEKAGDANAVKYYEEMGTHHGNIRDKATSMSQKTKSVIIGSKNGGYDSNVEEVKKYEEVFPNFKCNP